MGRNNISLASIMQKEASEPEAQPTGSCPLVPLIFMTHRTREGSIRSANRELAALSCVRSPWVCLPVADE
jgi:hypothetical protein